MKEHLRVYWLAYFPAVCGIAQVMVVRFLIQWPWSDAVFSGTIALGVVAVVTIIGLLQAIRRRDRGH